MLGQKTRNKVLSRLSVLHWVNVSGHWLKNKCVQSQKLRRAAGSWSTVMFSGALTLLLPDSIIPSCFILHRSHGAMAQFSFRNALIGAELVPRVVEMCLPPWSYFYMVLISCGFCYTISPDTQTTRRFFAQFWEMEHSSCVCAWDYSSWHALEYTGAFV